MYFVSHLLHFFSYKKSGMLDLVRITHLLWFDHHMFIRKFTPHFILFALFPPCCSKRGLIHIIFIVYFFLTSAWKNMEMLIWKSGICAQFLELKYEEIIYWFFKPFCTFFLFRSREKWELCHWNLRLNCSRMLLLPTLSIAVFVEHKNLKIRR